MDESQADAITRAIREPERATREAAQRRRAATARSLAERRVVAGFALPGIALGAVLAQAAGQRFTVGMLWGAIGGSVLGWAVVLWRRGRRPS